jgi:hypothetical protein
VCAARPNPTIYFENFATVAASRRSRKWYRKKIFRPRFDLFFRLRKPHSSCKDENHSARRCRPAATPGKSSRKSVFNPVRVENKSLGIYPA